MTDDTSRERNRVIERMIKRLGRLNRQASQVIWPTPTAPRLDAADMTDKQLHHEIHDVGGRLLNSLAPVLQRSFADDASHADGSLQPSLPTSVHWHTLMFFTQANDAFGLALRGLNAHATASALAPIRNIAETLALMKWLLEDSSPDVRRSRAYRLTLDAADQYRGVRKTLERVGTDSAERGQLVTTLAFAEERLRKLVMEVAEQDGIPVADGHGSFSSLLERYLPGRGGYIFYALLSNAGVHPGAARSVFFYTKPGTGIVDFDFKGMFIVRSYWIGQAISLHLELCHLVASVLGWQEWDAIAEKTESQLAPLAKEAERRFFEPWREAAANLPGLQRP